MAIRNIDAQIMLQRTTDAAREASILQRNAITAQEQVAEQNKADSALDKSRVLAATEGEMENIHTDADGSGSGATGSGLGDGSNEEETAKNIDEDLLLPPSDEIKIIDIMI